MPCSCSTLSRRDLLRLGAVAAAAPTLATLLPGPAALAAEAAAAGQPVPQDAELVTVTESTLVVTWFTGDRLGGLAQAAPEPVETGGEVVVRRLDGTEVARVDEGRRTAHHMVEVTGLRSGTTYTWEARSDGLTATPRIMASLDIPALNALLASGTQPTLLQLAGAITVQAPSPGLPSATTLVLPPGRLLATLALANDVHIGETVSGVISGDFPPPVTQLPGRPPYPEVMAAAMVADARARGAEVLLVAGDLTAEAVPVDVARSKELLDGFGRLRAGGALAPGDYVVSRGNHDRPHVGGAYDGCPAVQGAPDHHDCLGATYPLPLQQISVATLRGLRIIGLDTTMLDAAGGTMSDAQLAALAAELGRDSAQPTLVFGHHPVTEEAVATTLGGPAFDLAAGPAQRLEQIYAEHPGVFLHHSGHTHRNNRTASPQAPGVEFLEVCATKEYPGAFTLLRLFEGGYVVSSYKTRSDLAREWSQRSSGEYFGLYPSYVLGAVEARNHVVLRDLSRVASGAPGAVVPESALPVVLPLGAWGAAAALGAAARDRRRDAAPPPLP